MALFSNEEIWEILFVRKDKENWKKKIEISELIKWVIEKNK